MTMPTSIHLHRSMPAGLALLAAALLAACAGPSEQYVVRPGESGGRMTLTPREGAAMTLDGRQPQAQVRGGKAEPAQLDEQALQQRFGDAMSVRPQPPASFTLYFVGGSDQLTEESQRQVKAVLDAITQRPAPDLVVIGHTDRVGSLEDNDRLSRRRAETVRKLLLGQGVTAEQIAVTGRGERQPLVPTADEVAEPRNRRVEIQVR
jgi:OmpA-OmpF porin, OOP family